MPPVRRAEMLVEQGRLAEVPALEAFVQEQLSFTEHPNVLVQLPDYARAMAAAGRRDEALDLLRRQIELAERISGPGALGWRLLALAQITGDLDDLRRAADALSTTPYEWHHTVARLELGAALRRDGQRVAASSGSRGSPRTGSPTRRSPSGCSSRSRPSR